MLGLQITVCQPAGVGAEMSACQAQRPVPPNWQSEVHGGGLGCAWDTEGIQSIAHGQRRVRERVSEEDKDASTDGTEDRHGGMEPERREKMRGGKGSLTPRVTKQHVEGL